MRGCSDDSAHYRTRRRATVSHYQPYGTRLPCQVDDRARRRRGRTDGSSVGKLPQYHAPRHIDSDHSTYPFGQCCRVRWAPRLRVRSPRGAARRGGGQAHRIDRDDLSAVQGRPSLLSILLQLRESNTATNGCVLAFITTTIVSSARAFPSSCGALPAEMRSSVQLLCVLAALDKPQKV